MKGTEKRKSTNRRGAFIPEKIKTAVASLAAGYLLTSGIAGGALSAGWNVTALLSEPTGPICAALLFGIGCAAVRLARKNCSAEVTRMTLVLTVTANALSGMSVQSILTILAALLLTDGRKPSAWQLVLLAASAAAGFFCLPELSAETGLRLCAVCSCLGSAGASGFALSRMSEGENPLSLTWLIAGTAAGMVG